MSKIRLDVVLPRAARLRFLIAILSFVVGAMLVVAASKAVDASPAADRDVIAHCTGCDFSHVNWSGADLHLSLIHI